MHDFLEVPADFLNRSCILVTVRFLPEATLYAQFENRVDIPGVCVQKHWVHNRVPELLLYQVYEHLVLPPASVVAASSTVDGRFRTGFKYPLGPLETLL